MKNPFWIQFDIGNGWFNDSISFKSLSEAQCEMARVRHNNNYYCNGNLKNIRVVERKIVPCNNITSTK